MRPSTSRSAGSSTPSTVQRLVNASVPTVTSKEEHGRKSYERQGDEAEPSESDNRGKKIATTHAEAKTEIGPRVLRQIYEQTTNESGEKDEL